MSNFFDTLLKDTIWSAPTGDWQYPLHPAKISPSNGFIYSFNIGNTIIQLPDSVNAYHVFQVGRLNPELLKLTIGNDSWLTLEQMINKFNMYAMGHTDYGIVFPRSNIYYRFHENKNMYFILKWDYNVNVDYIALENLYIRLFMSTYLENNPSLNVGQFQCLSNTINTSSDVETLSSFYNQFPEENTSVWINGYLGNIDQVTPGVTADVVYDPSFKYSTILRLSSLPVFLSTLDNQRKYLFHIDPENVNELDFLNNIDFYLIGQTNGKNYGLYIHRNNVSNIRNVTFHDYAIKAINIQNCLPSLPLLQSSYDYYILANVRYSGFNINMIDTKNRLLSLYNINPDSIVSLIAGLNSNSIWNAATLESSNTNLYMQSYVNQLSGFSPLEVGGYFSTTKALCSPIVNIESSNVVTVPPCYTHGFTALEFANGLLSNISYTTENGVYRIVNPSSNQVYFLNGIYAYDISSIYNIWNSGNYTVPTNIEYRVYSQNSQDDYIDITSEVSSTETLSGTVLTYPSGYNNAIVKTNQYFLMQSFKLQSTIEVLECVINDIYFTKIPYGTVDVFLNGYYLTNKVDYYIADNIVYITNYNYVNTTTYNNIVVLCRGFCNSDMESLELENFSLVPNSSGFIEDFNTKVNNEYRPLVITINNLLYNYEEVLQNSFIKSDILYISSKTPLINAHEYLNSDSQTLLEESLGINTVIKNIENNINNPSVNLYPVNNKVILISAFLSEILTNLINGNYDEFVYSDYVEADIGNYFLSLSQNFIDDPLWNDRVEYVYFAVVGFNIQYSVSLNKQYFDFYVRVLKYYSNERLDYYDTVTNLSIVM
jgi:hypothetical protein